MYTSPLFSKEPLIDDNNWRSHCGPKSDTEEGRGRIPRDWDNEPYGAHAVAQPFDIPLIPRGEWAARIEEIDRTKTSLVDLADLAGQKSLDQNGTNYCWCNGVVTAMNLLQARDMPPQAFVSLSPASVAAQIKGYRNNGGWGGDALEWIVEKGIYTTAQWPANYWRNAQYKNAAADTEALTRRVTEWYELRGRNFAQLATLLLLRIPVAVGYSWWSHEVCACSLVALGRDSFGVRIRNSWGDGYGDHGFAVLSESKGTPDDAVAPRVHSIAFQ